MNKYKVLKKLWTSDGLQEAGEVVELDLSPESEDILVNKRRAIERIIEKPKQTKEILKSPEDINDGITQ
jgi:hypothetical protein